MKDQDELVANITQYQRIIGKLIYLTITRLNITYVVSQVSQHMQAPCQSHMKVVDRILKYLKKVSGQGLWYKKNDNIDIKGFSDADWAGSLDRRSTTGYCVYVGDNLVSWKEQETKYGF